MIHELYHDNKGLHVYTPFGFFLNSSSLPAPPTHPTMPKSKRAQVVHLTKAKQDRRALKRDLAALVCESVVKYASVYVVSFADMRNVHLKGLRAQWADTNF